MRTQPRRILTGVLAAFLTGICGAQEAETPKAPPETTPKPAAIEDEATEAKSEATPEEEAEEARHRVGRFYVEFNVWFVQPTGLEYSPATEFDSDLINGKLLTLGFHTQSALRSKFAWVLPNDNGEIVGTYVAYAQTSSLTMTSPGNYIYFENEAPPVGAGVSDNGLADGFVSEATVTLREVRFDYARLAFDTPHATGKWFAGWRRVTQKWDTATQYYSLVQDPDTFPPSVPPGVPGLAPLPDRSSNFSEYNGRGVEGGLDVKFPFGQKKKFAFETGLAVAALRGKVYTTSHAENAVYDASSGTVQQTLLAIGLTSPNISRSALAVDAYMGFRWQVWRDLEVFAGIRDQYYDGAGEIRRAWTPTQPQSLTATHEGYYLGAAYLF